jgi:YaaC-like protein
MPSDDWSKIRFLESIENLKQIVHQSTGRTPSTTIARDIAACLQQGRIFFEIASEAPLQVKPLQIYYGIVGFAKAIILARRVRSISTIIQSHGLSDISQQDAKIEELSLQFNGSGLFAQFNDTVAELGRYAPTTITCFGSYLSLSIWPLDSPILSARSKTFSREFRIWNEFTNELSLKDRHAGTLT